MPAKNIFDKPFDEGTLIKLKIYKDYFKEWLPVFVSRREPIWHTVQVFDFFAGQGKDINNEPGSPLLAIEVIQSLMHYAKEREIRVILHLNEKDKDTFEALRLLVNPDDYEFEVKLYNQDFKNLFITCYESMKSSANFLFLDQNGIKEITEELFSKMIALKQTDFLFYISSSYFIRFANTPEFQKYFPFPLNEIKETSYFHIHRKILAHYKSLIPGNKPYYLAPFSIKKGPNIYGLIFGTNHTLGIEKFLSIAWKNDKMRGEANYDIDNEHISVHMPSLFEQYNKPNKRQVFESNLTEAILQKKLTSNHDVYLYTLNEGFLLKDANVVLKKLNADKKISYDFNLITSDLHKDKYIKSITLL